jgi:hypothetical protein
VGLNETPVCHWQVVGRTFSLKADEVLFGQAYFTSETEIVSGKVFFFSTLRLFHQGNIVRRKREYWHADCDILRKGFRSSLYASLWR